MLRLLAGTAVSSGVLRTRAGLYTLSDTVRQLGSLSRNTRVPPLSVISTADNERSSTYAGWVFGSFAVGECDDGYWRAGGGGSVRR